MVRENDCFSLLGNCCINYFRQRQGPSLSHSLFSFHPGFIGGQFNLLPSIETNPLNPGQSTNLDQTFEANICNGIDSTAQVNVGATPPNGEQCQNTGVYQP